MGLDDQGTDFAGGGLNCCLRDLARFGEMMRCGGEFQGKRVLSERTVADIARGGSTLRDFVGSDGQSGYFQLEAFVYDRAGLPCRVCGTPIRQIVQGQRSTFYCPTCQR